MFLLACAVNLEMQAFYRILDILKTKITRMQETLCDQERTAATRKLIEELHTLGRFHSIELPDGRVLPGLLTPEQLHERVRQFPIPDDLRGKRVLDIGAWDGWFSFEMEKRGASVVAVDVIHADKFFEARDMLNSKVEYIVSDVYDLNPAELGTFDIVLFLGVLYHLKHPLLALERVCALSTDMVCIGSFVTDTGMDRRLRPSMEFYETDELCGRLDNWIGPNTTCLTAMCRTAGFVRVKLESVLAGHAHVTCYRKWEHGAGSGPAPAILGVENCLPHHRNFSAKRDDYLSVTFTAAYSGLTEDDVFLETGDLAARPMSLEAMSGDGWHAAVKLPPGIFAGWHDVKLRVRDSGWSNVVRIGVDVMEEEHRQ